MRFQPLLAWLALVVAASWPLLTSLESLWVDELHSAWVVDGPWKEVVHRGAIGNQSGLYFVGLKLWQTSLQTVLKLSGWHVSPELLLRLFSWLSWVAIVGWLGYSQRQSSSTLLLLAGWLWLDRIGSFYAIETRPYVWVALFSILLMSAATRIPADPRRIHWNWVLAATLIFYTHYTSVIVVALSLFAVCMDLFLASIGDKSDFIASIRLRVLEGVIFLFLAVPGLISLLKIGGESQQWNDFAGDYSLYSIVELLPWLAWCVIPAMFLVGEKIAHSKESISFDLKKDRRWLIQAGVVGFGVMIAVWSLTSLGVAPLMHRRYAIGAYPALLIVGACLASQLRNRTVVLLACFVSLIFLGWSQGTFSEWSHGRWLAWQRQENWRLVSEYLAKHVSDDDLIFVAPMLVETKGTELPVDLPVNYLTAPLTTHYQVFPETKLFPLPNDHRGWNGRIVLELDRSKSKSAWVVVRSSFSDRFAGPLLEMNSDSSFQKSIVLTPKLNAGRVQLFYAKPLNEEP